MNGFFKKWGAFALMATALGTSAQGPTQEQAVIPQDSRPAWNIGNRLGGGSKSRTHLKTPKKNADKKRKALIKMRRKSRQINRNS